MSAASPTSFTPPSNGERRIAPILVGPASPKDIADLMTKMSDTVDTVNATILDLKGEIDTALQIIARSIDGVGTSRSIPITVR